MDFLDKRLQEYSELHTSSESELLNRINRETHIEVLRPRMLSGHLQGRLLSMISHMIRPSRVLEVGTYTGYSAICLAEGLAPDGKLITIDNNAELESRVRDYFNRSGFKDQIDLIVGNALDVISGLPGMFDFVFIDADKENYVRYFDLVIGKVRKGGFVLGDNVLWSGKVIDDNPDKQTSAILQFNSAVHNDPRVENVLLPVRDGILIARKL